MRLISGTAPVWNGFIRHCNYSIVRLLLRLIRDDRPIIRRGISGQFLKGVRKIADIMENGALI